MDERNSSVLRLHRRNSFTEEKKREKKVVVEKGESVSEVGELETCWDTEQGRQGKACSHR